MTHAELDEVHAVITIARRNISNLKYADNTTLMVESLEELKGLLMKVKEETEKAVLKLNIQKSKIIYTMEYYSAIKKNSFGSFLMRWMKLEPII